MQIEGNYNDFGNEAQRETCSALRHDTIERIQTENFDLTRNTKMTFEYNICDGTVDVEIIDDNVYMSCSIDKSGVCNWR